MSEEPQRYRRWRLPLIGRAAADGEPVVDTMVEIDERMIIITVRRRRGDRACPRAGIQTDQYEPSEVLERPLVCC